MKIKQIVKTALIDLGLSEVATELDSQAYLTSENLPLLKKLKQLANIVVNETALEYFPLYKTEEMTSDNFEYSFTNFANCPLKIKSVKNSVGEEIDFINFMEYVKAESNHVYITYEYLPNELDFEEDCGYDEAKLSSRILAYGVTAEYYLINGDFNQANAWQQKYKESAMNLLKPKNIKIPQRRWA